MPLAFCLAITTIFNAHLLNWTKIFTVIANEEKQSQPLRLLHFTSFHMASATQRLRNDIV
ncbi:hypothetical protein FJR37_21095 [Aphanizomenon sp. UHCC 0183]|nr:hypothetical protein [Aphanizomenon sp. UHCC 0183]